MDKLADNRVKPLLALAVLLPTGTLPLLLGRFHTLLATEIMIWGLFALSFNLLYGYTGMLSFGQAIFFGTGSYILHYSFEWGLSLPIALLLGALLSGLVGLLLGLAASRVKGARFFLITLVGSILFYLIALDNRWLTGGDDGLIVQATFPGVTHNFYLTFIVCLLATAIVLILLRSPIGLIFKMIRENEERAASLGYWTEGYKSLAFSFGGILGGLAGGLYSYINGFVSADFFHWTHSADPVIWTIFGGPGTISGGFVGAATLTFLRETLSSAWADFYPVIVGVVLLASVILFPDGLVGIFTSLYHKLQNTVF